MNAIGGLKDLVARIDERTKAMADDLTHVKEVLIDGNGVPPLTVTVARLDERVKTMEEAEPQRLGGGDRYMLYGALVSGVVTLIEMLARHIHG